jgi:hypothetical protein
MSFDIDISGLSHGPHWLSGAGKVNIEAIRAKRRAEYYANRQPKRKPATPETNARLVRVMARSAKRAQLKKIKV